MCVTSVMVIQQVTIKQLIYTQHFITVIQKLHFLFYLLQYILSQHDRSINIQTVYTATIQADFMAIVVTK